MEGEKYGKDIRRPGWEDAGDSWEDVDQELMEVRYAQLTRALQEHGISLDASKKILEVGSGKGFFVDYLRKQGLDAVGVDARPRSELQIPQAAALIEQLPFADETFDVVFSAAVFDGDVYRQNQRKMILEITRVLKKDGVYFSSTDSIHVPVPMDKKITSGDVALFEQVYKKDKKE
jgi:SAM-dependent methyltransferase